MYLADIRIQNCEEDRHDPCLLKLTLRMFQLEGIRCTRAGLGWPDSEAKDRSMSLEHRMCM